MEALRLKGNEAFTQQRLADAADLYREALGAFDSLAPSAQSAALDEVSKCVGNLCLCLQRLQQWDALLEESQKGLRRNPLIAKAHCFLAIAAIELLTPRDGAQPQCLLGVCDPLKHLAIGARLQPSVVTPAVVEAFGKAITLLPKAPADGAHEALPRDLPNLCEARETDGSGRGVFALCKVPCGAVVCRAAAPFSVAACSDIGPSSICHCCGAPALPETPFSTACVRCSQVFYCSDACFAANVHRHSTLECQWFVRLREMLASIDERSLDVPEEFADLAAHVISTLSGFRMAPPALSRELLLLEAHTAEVSQSLTPAAPLLHDLIPDERPELLATLLGIVRCNSFSVADETGLSVGQALHAGNMTSLFNHSCAPNCLMDCRQTIVTMRDVSVGEQLTVSYIPQLFWPKKLRQDGLAERYFFTCRCSRCEPPLPTAAGAFVSGLDAYDLACCLVRPGCARPCATEYHHQVVQNVCGGIRMRPVSEVSESDASELEDLLRSVLVDLPEHHYLVQDVRNCMTFVYAVIGRQEKVLESALEELLTWECIVPGLHPTKVAKVRNASLCQAPSSTDGTQNKPASLAMQVLAPHLPALLSKYI
jgi:hypothetical protein